jgi:D-alanyl-D-alanine carboxypeptidase/D-alanyl-D-alanine-endopeptidase (penicillin-binding protein 4)
VRRAAVILLGTALLAPAPAAALNQRQLTKILDRQMGLAGPYSGAYVEDIDTGTPLYDDDADVKRAPASVEKLYTTVATQATFGDRARFTTAVLADQWIRIDGALPGNLYLRGGGDPTLSLHDIKELAKQIDHRGILRVTGRVVGDPTAFDGRPGVPSAGFKPSPDVSPLTGLVVDRGASGSPLHYQFHPATWAADKLTAALRKRGVTVRHRAVTGATAPLGFALAWRRSPTVGHLLKLQNVYSDNYYAETMLKQVARAAGGRGSTERGALLAHRIVARKYGINPTIIDGSGLSRLDATSPREIVTLLTHKISDLSFVHSLPIVGQTGTVAYRARAPVTYNQCRAKTGTLSDVSALAGYCGTADGGTVAFAIINNHVNVYAAHLLQDKIITALVRYRS